MRWNTIREKSTGRVRLGDDYIVLFPSDMRCLGFDNKDLREDIPFELTVERDPDGNMWLLSGFNGKCKLAKRKDAILMNDYILLNPTELALLGLSLRDAGKRIRVRAIRTGHVARICCHDVIWNYPGLDIEELSDKDEAAIMESIIAGVPKGFLSIERDGEEWKGSWYCKTS